MEAVTQFLIDNRNKIINKFTSLSKPMQVCMIVLLVFVAIGFIFRPFISKILENYANKITDTPAKPSPILKNDITSPAPAVLKSPVKPQRFDELCKALEKPGQHILLSGEGGLGKSYLAQSLYHQLKGNYKKIGWVAYEGRMQTSLCNSVLLDQEIKDEQRRLSCIMEILNQNPRKTLLFVDNVRLNGKPDPLLESLTGIDGLSIVLTSREEELEPYETYDIPPFELDFAVELFYHYYRGQRRKRELVVVRKMIREVNRNTLEIKRLAKKIYKSGKSIAAFYRSENPDLLTFAALFDFNDVKDKKSQNILYTFAAMPSGVIPKEVIHWLRAKQNTFESLVDEGWLDESENGYSMHDKIREDIQSKGIPESTLKAFLDCLAHNRYIKSGEVYTSVLVKLELAEAVLSYIKTENLDYAYACHNLAWAYDGQAQFDRAIQLYETDIRIEEQSNPNSLSLAATYNNLGIVYDSKGDYDQALYYHKLAKDIREAQAPNSLDLAATYNNLGIVYRKQGDYDQALRYYNLDKKITEKQAPNSPDLASTVENIGIIYQKKGQYSEAEACYRQSFSICYAKLGDRHPDTARTYRNIGVLFTNRTDAPDYQKAALCALKAYSIDLAVFGKDHPYTKKDMDNLRIDYNLLHPSAPFDQWLTDSLASLPEHYDPFADEKETRS